jgi:hypothetical protein
LLFDTPSIIEFAMRYIISNCSSPWLLIDA